ncbi:hypothetical protein V7124_19430 [Neobacillus niacini]|uniref:hypothetical protein n=1 Tax=Neobacillus niacini TaxID=86668 RepID=UPI002FFF545A
MASKNFKATWMGQYRNSNDTYYGAGNPIRTGGSVGFHSYLGFDKSAILSAINSSSTAARVYLNIYVTDGGSFDLGMHKEGSNKATNGLPFYRYARKAWTFGTGWQRQDITDISLSGESLSGFKNILNGGYTGPVLYGALNSNQGEAYGVTNNSYHIYIEVTGTWNTAPGTPKITAPTAGQKVDKTFELKGTAASDAEQSASQLTYQWALNNGAGFEYFDWGSPGVVNKVLDFSIYAESTQAQVALRAFDGELYGPWVYSDRFTIQHNRPPGPPTNLSPVGGAQRDRTQAITFSWVHNDADGQSAYEIQWRLQGTTAWNSTGKVSSTSKSRVYAANTFPQGQIEWQVRTYDQESLVGAWSATAIFSATEPSDAPIITSPVMNESVPTSIINVSWNAAEQEEYEIQLVQDGVILWSETSISNIRVMEIPYTLENNSTYTIRLRVRLSAELFSSWAETTFNTSFTVPSQPIVELYEWTDEGSIEVRITNPITGVVGEPTVTSNDIYRRIYGTDDPYERIAVGIPNNGVFRDYTPASGVRYQYYVKAWGDNGTSNDSLAVNMLITIKNTRLSVASNPTRFIELQYNPSRSFDIQKDRTMLKFNGRQYPVAEFGYHETKKFSLSFAIRDVLQLELLLDIIDEKQTLLYRDSRGRREFVTIDSISVTDRFPNGYNVSFAPEKVEYIEVV